MKTNIIYVNKTVSCAVYCKLNGISVQTEKNILCSWKGKV